MSEADDLGALVLGLAERSINEYRDKPFPEDREPIVHYFSLLDNLVEATDSPYHFSRGVPMLRSSAIEHAKHYLAQETENTPRNYSPFAVALGIMAGSAAIIGLGILTQSAPLLYGGGSGFIIGCSGLTYAAAEKPRTPPKSSLLLKNYEQALDASDIFWISAFREYAPEIRCLVNRFKKEYAQEHTI